MNENQIYEEANIEGKESEVKSIVSNFVDSQSGETDEEKRVNLPLVKKALHGAVDFVMANLPDGVNRVDGYVIEPILKEVVENRISNFSVDEEV
jgi:hypothetical protein